MGIVASTRPPALAVDTPEAACALVDAVLGAAARRGASGAEASLSVSSGLSATVRLGEVDTVEHHRGKALAVTVYQGLRKGSAGSNDLRGEAIEATVAAACDIARHSGEDPFAGLVDPHYLAREWPELDLYHPWDLDAARAIAIALECEAAARAHDARISNSEGASVTTHAGLLAYGNSLGFVGAWNATRHSISCRVIAGTAPAMQREAWFSNARAQADLAGAAEVGAIAARRAVGRLGARKIATTVVPVLFEARAAASLFGHLLGAVSGAAQYRRASFLLDALDTSVCAAHIDISEQPHLPRAMGSAPFDGDGVATRAHALVDKGVLASYVLSAYSARRLGLTPTGNSGGVHNLVISHGGRDRAAIISGIERGLLVTELLGFGVNGTTGDYSRGAAGFWIERGEIVYPVEEITIAGNLRDMLMGIVEIGADVDTRGNVRTGSVLVEHMTLAGN
ncbi:MAG: metalloprotease PmbA [Gammaproteobacteria bacterium]|nr:metalloprotease PmbA [Gammaproteobacteria bacterium]